jgi:RimJ/RimL family protein N-acetyltransferase
MARFSTEFSTQFSAEYPTQFLAGFSTEFCADAEDFAAAIEPLISTDPVGATIVCGVLAQQIAVPYQGTPLMATVRDEERIRVAALRIPSYPMTAVIDPEIAHPTRAIDALAAAVTARSSPITGVSGLTRTAELLATACSARSGRTMARHMTLLFYRLEDLVEPVGVPGSPRPANIDDRADVELLADWFFAFRLETGTGPMPTGPEPDAGRRSAARGEVFTIWCDDDQPVAAAGHGAVRRGRARIAPVFTPENLRQRGYGSAVTAAAVRSAQRRGATEVTLFTDADYVASNSVYRRLGFAFVDEFAEFHLGEADSS